MTGAESAARWSSRDIVSMAVLALSVWLAWQAVLVVLVERAPPATVIGLASGSPLLLARAAEAEEASGRHDQAAALAADSLSRAPFNVRALRVYAQALSAEERMAEADAAMTLAGNWSLRDTPAHAWLIERRLQQGDYVSAFAHADTLLRRGQPIQDQVFQLLSTAAVEDGRGLAALLDLLGERPRWRRDYLIWLQRRDGMDSLLATLAVGLQTRPSPMQSDEFAVVYRGWAEEGRFGAMKLVREQTGRPQAEALMFASDFQPDADWPFGWRIESAAGVIAEAMDDDLGSGRTALRVEYNSRSSAVVASQLLLLEPGVYTLGGRRRVEFGDMRLDWRVRCMETGNVVSGPVSGPPAGSEWTVFTSHVTIPAQGCTAQSLELAPRPDDTRRLVGNWFFGLRLEPEEASR